jgi:hypothetical protein
MLTGMPPDGHFSKWGGQLAWKADFYNINQPKYTYRIAIKTLLFAIPHY